MREQLLKAGLVSEKQARDAERQLELEQRQQRQQKQHRQQPSPVSRPRSQTQERRAPEQQRRPAAQEPASRRVGERSDQRTAAGSAMVASAMAASAKVLRDQALNRQQHQKALRKARFAEIKQLIVQNRLPTVEGEERYHFVDGKRVRRIAIDVASRERLMRGEIVIVRHESRYDLVPAAIAERIRERDANSVIVCGTAKHYEPLPPDDAYAAFPVPDDLMW